MMESGANEPLTLGSICSGIGGFELGFERTGRFRTIWQCEVAPYQCGVLRRRFDGVPNIGDIWKIERFPEADVIVGGIPCQPVSIAGRRQAADDDRWLWPRFLDAIRQVRPRYAVLENVQGMLSADRGRAYGRISGDLAEIGYDCQWDCLSAAEFGAPHLRYRLFVVAYPDGERGGQEPLGIGRGADQAVPRHDGEKGHVADAHGIDDDDGGHGAGTVRGSGSEAPEIQRCRRSVPDTDRGGRRGPRIPILKGAEGPSEPDAVRGGKIASDAQGVGCTLPWEARTGRAGPANERPLLRAVERGGVWPPEPVMGGISDGLSPWLDGVAPYSLDGFECTAYGLEVRRATGATVKDRARRIECLGNAIVPQVARYVAECILRREGMT